MNQLRINNARVIDCERGLDEQRTLFIKDGVIAEHCDDNADTINAEGLIACNGFTDLYARLREPGFSRKGNIASESKAALKAGFTSVCCAPDTNPVIDSVSTVELIRQKANAAKAARIIPIAALTLGLDGSRLSEMVTLRNAGCLFVGNADMPIHDTGVLLSAMQYAASFDIPVMITPKDPAIAGNGCAHAGAVATKLGLPSLPVEAETIALTTCIELCKSTGCRLHLSRLSSARSVELVRLAKQDGLPITADVGIHHLYFTDEQLDGYDVNFHSAVPFRSSEDRDALRAGLANGVIDAICSDHAPHDTDAKLAPFPSSAPGLSGFDAFLPMLLGLHRELDVSLPVLLGKVSSAPQDIMKSGPSSYNGSESESTEASGMQVGAVADLILIDTDAPAQLDKSNILSKGLNSPLFNLHDASEEHQAAIELADAAQSLVAPLSGVVKYCWVAGEAIDMSTN